MTNNIVRKHIIFKGWVQGVGFRYRASSAAELYGVSGWVKNEFDGSVSMEIQGTHQQILDVITAIKLGSYIRIEDMDMKTTSVIPDERGFRVKY